MELKTAKLLVNGYMRLRCKHIVVKEAWNVIRKELEEISKTPDNRAKVQICPDCFKGYLWSNERSPQWVKCSNCDGSGKL